MAKKSNSNLIVGLDIGTSKVLAIVGEVSEDGEIEIIGVGHHPAKGLRKGVVSNIESTVQSIQRAVEEAELMAGCQIYSVFAGIAGAHISSFNSHGVVAIKDNEVAPGDIERVIDAAKAMAIPNDQRILHVMPQDFIIDGQDGIREPVGMCGVRMEAKVHMITGAVSAAQNIVKCIRRCGLEVDDIILEQIASSESVLTEDERELGVCMIDIGGGTTDIAIFTEGAIRHTAVIPIAGDQVTNDIAVAFHTPTQAAEELKKKYGCTLVQMVDEGQMIQTPSMGGRPPRDLSRQNLAEIIEPRMEELLLLVQAELRRSGFEDLVGSGIVLTGGSSRIEGMMELAEEIFHLPVRLGLPNYSGGLSEVVRNPIYATGIGLVQFGHANKTHQQHRSDEPGKFRSILTRMKSWFRGSF
ncbi:MAG: cell division protein FtsA [Pseudomonadota bacterium]